MPNLFFDKNRLIFAIIFLFLGIAMLLITIKYSTVFYSQPLKSFQDYPRYLGCISFSFIGFSFLLFSKLKFIIKKDFPHKYLWYYPTICIMGSSIVFTVCQMYDKLNGYLFYFIAFPMSFISAYLADYFWKIIINKLGKWID